MKPKTILRRMAFLMATLMCALGANAQEAYACYTSENTTLTFYYDNQRSSREGTTYDLNTGKNDTGWYTDGIYRSVTQVVFDPSFAVVRPTITYKWFNNMKKLLSIEGLNNLNTSEVTNMFGMFSVCEKLTSLDLSGFNTAQVTDMGGMFWKCGSLKTIYVGNGWSTAAVTGSSKMFEDCTKLKGGQGTTYDASHVDKTYAHIDGGSSNPGYFTTPPEAYACYTPTNRTLTFYYDSERNSREDMTYDLNTGSNDTEWEIAGVNEKVSKVVFDPSFADARPTSTYGWFYYMKDLESITGMSYLNTNEVTNMNWMFGNCKKLSSLDLSHFNTSKVTEMQRMFVACLDMKSLDLSSFNTSNVTDMFCMFWTCTNLQAIYVGNGWSTAAVTESKMMFQNCTNLVGGMGTTWNESNSNDKIYAHIDGGPNNPGYFTAAGTEPYACYQNGTLTFYYDNQRDSRTGTTYSLKKEPVSQDWFNDKTNANVTRVVFDSSFAHAHPTNTYGWFSNMKNLQTISNIGHLNTSEVTSMASMFANCTSLTTLNLTHFNTGMTTDMRAMFGGCTNLRTIYVGDGWSTENVTDTYSVLMFNQCTSLVGGQGTTWKATNPSNKTYAHVDGGPNNPGYFTYSATGIATSIEAVPDKVNTVKGIYTLDGRKLNELPTQKGFYIIDGNKVVIQ